MDKIFLNYLGEPIQPSKIKNTKTGEVHIRDCDYENCEANESCQHCIKECNGGFTHEWCGNSLMLLYNCAITI